MKKVHTSQPSAVVQLLKSFTAALSSLFFSSNNRDFKRLKDFITS